MQTDQIINNRYKILSELGKGGYGQVYKVEDLQKSQPFALKLELSQRGSISQEVKVLQDLQGGEGIPRLYDHNKFNGLTYMVLDLLGLNLSSMRKSLTTFSLNTVTLLLNETLTRIEYLHSQGYIHRDIKPQQFLIGPKETIYLVDYGISKKFIIDGHHMAFQSQCERAGSSSYASINSHIGIRLARRDDLESWLYLGIFLQQGFLPWQQPKGVNDNRKWQTVFTIKRNTKDEELFVRCPKQFQVILTYIRSIKFEEKPNYLYLRDLIAGIRNEFGLGVKVLDWVLKEKGKIVKEEVKNVQITKRRSMKKKVRNGRRNKTMTPATLDGLMVQKMRTNFLIPPALSRTASRNSQEADSSDCETIRAMGPEFVDREGVFRVFDQFWREIWDKYLK